jgi:hypothetical protein
MRSALEAVEGVAAWRWLFMHDDTKNTRGEGMVAACIPYDLFQITAPINRQNRTMDSPCHTLAKDNAAHASVVAFTQNTRDEVRQINGDGQIAGALAADAGMKQTNYIAFAQNQLGEVRTNSDVMGTVNQNQNASGRNTPMVAFSSGCQHQPVDALYTKCYTRGQRDACTQEAYAGSVLRVLRQEVGEKDFAQWGLGILDSLHGEEVLRSSVLGQGDGAEEEVSDPETGREVVGCPPQGKKHLPKGRVSKVRKAGRERRASQGWKLSEQLAGKLGAYLQELSHERASAEAVVRDLWQASDGLRVLRDALPEIQEVGRSTSREGQPVYCGSHGYGSERKEEVRGSGVRGVGACAGSLRSSLDAEEAWDARQAAEDEERNSKRNVGQAPLCVRRLVPRECEILQGFPPDYTDVPYRKKPAADGPRYRALGNSMAVPCMWWLGLRIHKATS